MRPFLHTIVAVLALSGLWPASANAQDFPTKPIFIVVGPGPDTVARLVAQKMLESWGQQVLIDPQPAIGGAAAARSVSRAAADGYTLLLTTGSYSINEVLRPSLPYRLMTDFEPVAEIATLPFILVVPSTLPVKSLAELVALARSKPGEINCASSGVGTTAHLGCELLNATAKIKTVHVPYKGAAPVLTDLISNRVQLTFSVPTAISYIESGELRALAVTGPKRLPSLPNVPTVAEAGFPDLQFTSWNGLHAPAGTPKAVIAKINAEVGKIRNMPDFQQRLATLGFTPEGGTPLEFGDFVKADIALWQKVVKETGVKVE
ncbi:MAG TPA: tripartite tricarboxylate transporter substrate binding protein [Pseudolabrys sp.]|nr:tripartite tricarboxylate transporter substrate binding protein [Pseudolabrys sp.]